MLTGVRTLPETGGCNNSRHTIESRGYFKHGSSVTLVSPKAFAKPKEK